MKMTKQQWDEACRYANSNLKNWEVEMAMEAINENRGLPIETKNDIAYMMDEWCTDNGFDCNDWEDFGDEEDVFFNVNAMPEQPKQYVWLVQGFYEADFEHEIYNRVCADEDTAKKYVRMLIDDFKETCHTEQEVVRSFTTEGEWKETETSLYAWQDSQWETSIEYTKMELLTEVEQ